DTDKKKQLEAIIHPMVSEERIKFFEKAEQDGAELVVLDVPLLFETSGDKACHKVVVVSAPAEVQRKRVLARPNMTLEKFEHILQQQMPDAEKREGADYIVETDKGLEYAENQVAQIIRDIKKEVSNA
ncbi:MAG: dephospho-CoA kinase, partial [Kordiimonas sp.]